MNFNIVLVTRIVAKYMSYFICDHNRYSENHFPPLVWGKQIRAVHGVNSSSATSQIHAAST